MSDVNALYPQPTQQSTNFMAGDPSKVIGLVGAINQNALFNQTLNARKAIGQAYQSAIQDDGSIDTPALMKSIKENPDAGFLAGEASQGALSRQGQAISNTTAQLDQNAKQNGFIVDSLGALADDPKLNIDKVRGVATTLARNLKIPGQILNGWIDGLPRDPAQLSQSLKQMRNLATGSANLSTRVAAPPSDSGQPQTTTLGAANYKGTMPTGLAPGEQGLAESTSGRAARLQSTAATSPQYHADLDNLKQESKVLDNLGGPTFETEKKLNQLATRLGGFGITMTPDQLKAGESFDKIANQISLNQSQMFHGSDAGLHTVVGANPSSSMSKFGREGVIDMLQGNQDAIDITRKAWLKARANGAPASSYDLFAEQMGNQIDPRVFQFNRLSRDNQQKFLSQMGPQQVGEFEQKYKTAIGNKWVKPLKSPTDDK